MPRQRGVTEFLPKRGSLSLMGQGWVHNTNVTPSSYPTEFGVLWHGSAYSTHHKAKFSDGPFAKSDGFHWLRCIL